MRGTGQGGCPPGPETREPRRARSSPARLTSTPRCVGLEKHLDRAQIQPAPPPSTMPVVVTRTAASTTPAPARPPRLRSHVRDHHIVVLVELDVLEDRAVVQPEQPSPYPEHAPSPCLRDQRWNAGNVGRRRRTTSHPDHTPPTGTAEVPQFRSAPQATPTPADFPHALERSSPPPTKLQPHRLSGCARLRSERAPTWD